MTHLPLLLALQDAAPAVVPADTAWMLVSTALVLLMTPALAFFYGGLVRSKNSLNTMMMSFAALGAVGVVWALLALQPGVRRGRTPGSAAPTNALLAGVGHRGQGHHSARAVHGLPGHVRHHHGGADLRRRRRAHAVRAVPRVHRALDALRLRAGRPLGVGRRLAHDQGRARLRRRHRRAHQRRRLGAGGRARARRAARTTAARPSCRTTCRSCCSAPGCSGSAGSGSTAAARSPRTSSPPLAFTNTFLAPMATLVVWVLLDYFRTGRATAVGGATGIVVGLVAITPAAGFVSPMSALAARRHRRVPELLHHRVRGRARGSTTRSTCSRATASAASPARCSPASSPRRSGTRPATTACSRATRASLGTQALGVASSIVYAALATFVILKLLGPGHRAPRGAARRGAGHGRDPARRGGVHQRRGLDPRHARCLDPWVRRLAP